MHECGHIGNKYNGLALSMDQPFRYRTGNLAPLLVDTLVLKRNARLIQLNCESAVLVCQCFDDGPLFRVALAARALWASTLSLTASWGSLMVLIFFLGTLTLIPRCRPCSLIRSQTSPTTDAWHEHGQLGRGGHTRCDKMQ